MFTFTSISNGTTTKYQVSIERPTRLVLLEQFVEGEQYPRYIRLTKQQIDRVQMMWYKGNFASNTIPQNHFMLDENNFYLICSEDGQRLVIPIPLMAKIYEYRDKHLGHIARFDLEFKSRR